MFKSSTSAIVVATLAATSVVCASAQEDHTERLEKKITDAFTSLAKDDTVIITAERETGRPVLNDEE